MTQVTYSFKLEYKRVMLFRTDNLSKRRLIEVFS